MGIKTSTPSYGIAVMGNHCINCAEYIQYYCRRKDGNYTIHTAVDRGYCGARQCITRPGNRCKYYQGCGRGGIGVGSENIRQWYWLKSVVSANDFAGVDYNGSSTYTGATYANGGVRPFFCIG